MPLELITADDRIVAVRLAGQEFDCEPETGEANIPKRLLHGFRLSEIPAGLIIKPVESISNGTVEIRNDTAISPFVEGCTNVFVEVMERRRHWDGDIGLTPYIEAFRSAVREREDTKEVDFQDDGDYVSLTYEIEINEDLDIRDAIKDVEATIQEVAERTGQLANRLEDGPTGLLDRRSFDLDLAYALRRPLSEVGLTLVDLDRFKRVNDKFGHLVGDQVLREVAHVLSMEAKSNGGWAYRYGGEELAAIRVGFDRDSLAAFAERIRLAIRNIVISEVPSLRVTASIGLALSPHDGQSAPDLFRQADKALYRAKRDGRNCVRGSWLSGKRRDRSPFLVWTAVVVLAVSGLLALVASGIRTYLGRSRPANEPAEQHIGTNSVQALRVPGPMSGNSTQVSFTTSGRGIQEITLGVHPTRIFVEPPGIALSEVDLPKSLNIQGQKVVLSKFTSRGFTVETNSEGIKLRVSVLEASEDQGKRQPFQSPNESSAAYSAIGALSVLGWQVQPGEGNRLQFSDIYKHISLRRSAPYFCAMDRPFNVDIVGARSLDGVGELRNAKNLTRLELNAAEITDLSEIKYLRNLQVFVMGQTAGHISDLSPLKDLTNLTELGLDSPAIRDLTPIQNLTGITILSIGGTQVSDISPLRNFHRLSSLNLGGAPVSDLSPLGSIYTLTSLQMTGAEIPALVTLVHEENLKSLSIYAQQTTVDLSPIAGLSGLETLDLNFFGTRTFDVSPVQRLEKLKSLSIDGNGFDYFSSVGGLAAIGALTNLEKLKIFGVQITDLNFAATLRKLNELSVTNSPLSDISALRQLRSLNEVSLTGTSVVDISPLLNLPELKQLGIVRTPARSDVVSELELRGVKIQR